MTYAIGQFVYGLNLNDQTFSYVDSVVNFIRETYDEYVSTAYSGNGDEPRWVGPVLNEIDECNDAQIDQDFLSSLHITPDVQQKFDDKLRLILEAMEEDKEELIEECGQDEYDRALRLFTDTKPSIWLMWGSS